MKNDPALTSRRTHHSAVRTGRCWRKGEWVGVSEVHDGYARMVDSQRRETWGPSIPSVRRGGAAATGITERHPPPSPAPPRLAAALARPALTSSTRSATQLFAIPANWLTASLPPSQYFCDALCAGGIRCHPERSITFITPLIHPYPSCFSQHPRAWTHVSFPSACVMRKPS